MNPSPAAVGMGKLHPKFEDAAMQNAVAIQLDLPKPVAEAWLASLRAELRRAMTEHWYVDRYRTVPDFQRSNRILDDYPALMTKQDRTPP